MPKFWLGVVIVLILAASAEGLHAGSSRAAARHIDAAALSVTVHHLADVRQKVADLRKIERVLGEMAAQCDGGKVPKCPVIDALFDESQNSAAGSATDTQADAPSGHPTVGAGSRSHGGRSSRA